MAKLPMLIAVAAGLSIATASWAAPSEVGYVKGSLAVDDLQDGRLDRAEKILAAESAADAADPARLINLGIVYARSGRMDAARTTFIAAGRAPEESLFLSDGSEVSSRTVARQQLSLLGPAFAATR